MTTNTPSHHVTQPVSATVWLEEPSVTSAADPIKQKNNSPTAPNHPISAAEPTKHLNPLVQSPSSTPAQPNTQDPQDLVSSASTSYQNGPPHSSPIPPTNLHPTAAFSQLTPPLSSQPQPTIPYQERSSPPSYHPSASSSLPKPPPRTSTFLSRSISADLQPETLPPNQFSQQSNQAHEYRQSNATNRFSSLLSVSNRETAQYPTVSVSQSQSMPSEHNLPPISTAPVSTPPTLTPIQHSHEEPSMACRTTRDSQNFNYTQDAFRPPPYGTQHPQAKLFEGIEQMQKREGHFRERPTQNNNARSTFNAPSHEEHIRPVSHWHAGQHQTIDNHSKSQFRGSLGYPPHVINYRQSNFRPPPICNEVGRNMGREGQFRSTPYERTSDPRNARESPIPLIAMQMSWEAMLEALQSYEDDDQNSSRTQFLEMYSDLMKCYEAKCAVTYDTIDNACINQIISSRIPFLVDSVTAPVEDETPQDVQQKLVVKQKFVEAMERLQADQMPTKRRGNLPKESTAYLRKWFEDHYDNPCKFRIVFPASCYHLEVLSLSLQPCDF